jgi:hypothetical protein
MGDDWYGAFSMDIFDQFVEAEYTTPGEADSRKTARKAKHRRIIRNSMDVGGMVLVMATRVQNETIERALSVASTIREKRQQKRQPPARSTSDMHGALLKRLKGK